MREIYERKENKEKKDIDTVKKQAVDPDKHEGSWRWVAAATALPTTMVE